jgi:hypothetical protein
MFMTNNSKSNGLPFVDPIQQSRQKSNSYPRFTLQKAEELAKAIFNLGARSCDPERVAQVAGYSIKSGSYLGLKSTASQFELINVDKKGCLSVSEDWIEVFHHFDDLQQIKKARRDAISRPKLYKQLIEEYTDRQLPNLDKLSRELHLNQKYGILKDAAEVAARIFTESASHAGLLDDRGYLVVSQDLNEIQIDKDNSQPESIELKINQELANQANNKPQTSNSSNLLPEILPNLEGLEKYEITLTNRKKAYIYVPVPLPYGEKKRLQQYIDLILEEPFNFHLLEDE